MKAVTRSAQWSLRPGAARGDSTLAPGSFAGTTGLVVVGLAVLAGLALRIYLLTHQAGVLDSDEAVVGLMARHILRGQYPTFFWGQPYGGTLEAYLTAAVFAVAGSSTAALKLVPFALDAGAALLVWRVGRRLVGEPAGRAGACLFWIWPAAFVWSSIRARGFYGVALTITLAILLLAVRLSQEDRVRDWLALGLALGAGWWTTPEVAFVAAPVGLWLVLVADRGRRRLVTLAVPAAFVAALPWLVWNLRHHLASLHPAPQGPAHNTYLLRLHLFFTRALPGALGLRVPLSAHWLGQSRGGVAYLALLGLLAWAALRWRSELAPLLMVAALYPFAFALSPYSWYVDEPRYLLLLSPVLALILGCLLARWRAAATGLAAALVLTVAGIPGIAPNLPYPNSDAGLIAALRNQGIHAAFGDYWVSYRLTFETREQIIVSPVANVRYAPDDALVRRQPLPAYVFLTGTLPEHQFVVALGNLGVTYRAVTVEGFTVYLPARAVVPPPAGAPPGPVQLASPG